MKYTGENADRAAPLNQPSNTVMRYIDGDKKTTKICIISSMQLFS